MGPGPTHTPLSYRPRRALPSRRMLRLRFPSLAPVAPALPRGPELMAERQTRPLSPVRQRAPKAS